MNAYNRLLIIDDVFSSGSSIQAVIQHLQSQMRRNMPNEVRIATTWYKPAQNKSARKPDFFVNETDQWLVLPYELNGLSDDEIARHKPYVKALADNLKL